MLPRNLFRPSRFVTAFQSEDHPGYNLDTALNTAFEEYNNFGLARQSTQFRLSEREMYGIKALKAQTSLSLHKP